VEADLPLEPHEGRFMTDHKITRPAIVNERLTLNRAGQVVPTLIRISPTSIIAILTDGNQ
jgi:hypothetical protein